MSVTRNVSFSQPSLRDGQNIRGTPFPSDKSLGYYQTTLRSNNRKPTCVRSRLPVNRIATRHKISPIRKETLLRLRRPNRRAIGATHYTLFIYDEKIQYGLPCKYA